MRTVFLLALYGALVVTAARVGASPWDPVIYGPPPCADWDAQKGKCT